MRNPFRNKHDPDTGPLNPQHQNGEQTLAAPVTSLSSRGVDPGNDNGGASWGEVHIAGGDAAFALVPAPVGADPGRAQRGTDRAGAEAERGLHQDQDQPTGPSEPAAPDVERFAPTVTPDAFVHHGVAANDLPSPAVDDTAPGSARRRRLSDVLYRPRSGTKRDVQLTCSAEPAERDFINHAAREAKRSRSAYLMDAALTFAHAYLPDQRPATVPALPSPQATQDLLILFGKLIREFHRVGNNLNQITRAIHTGELPDRAMEVLDELHQVALLSRRVLEQVLAGGGRRGA
ncbi:MobC family plasmid mobilization relaxosome protein [Streptomyces odonnellii]|uniref:MobC family plasmid mobilization relaxosome protein n=1 Tax=Streptomyces odonnellii TaxID=1417980 RepID=UPI0006266CF5|nr:MobC family plasmid mobilization relaxosome protein [Streptomyces odonnellii]